MSTAAICHLSELLQQVRDCTLALLDATPVDWALWAPPGTSNHVLWHAGHVLWVQDILILEPITGRSELAANWADTFGQDCRPVKETREWPALAFVIELLRQQQSRLQEVLKEADPAVLLDIAAPAEGWNLPRGIIHGLHDEARHQGEMKLLVKMRRAGKVS
jgi:hypothetical protein